MLGTRPQSWLCAARGPVDDLDTPEHLARLRQALAPAWVDWPPGASERAADQFPIDELQQNRSFLQAEPQSLI